MSRSAGSPNRKFIPTAQAVEQTGRSRFWLLSRIKSGKFQKGTHYRNTSDGRRPTYEFCIEEIEALYG